MRLRVALVVVGLVLLHFLLHVGIGWGAAAPDLLTLAVLLAAREVRMAWGALVGFGLGLLEDALSVLAFGASSVALTVVGAMGARTRDLFMGDSRYFAVTYLFVGKWLRDLIHWVAVGDGMRDPFVSSVLVSSSLSAAYMAVVGLAVLTLFAVSWESQGSR